ncbi:MAG: hypothetical protein NTX24_01095 [Candidatus Pacearchaeota archaeon]|nr:hypothetical protein [Candidatus Pacearchaeota archaeon]
MEQGPINIDEMQWPRTVYPEWWKNFDKVISYLKENGVGCTHLWEILPSLSSSGFTQFANTFMDSRSFVAVSSGLDPKDYIGDPVLVDILLEKIKEKRLEATIIYGTPVIVQKDLKNPFLDKLLYSDYDTFPDNLKLLQTSEGRPEFNFYALGGKSSLLVVEYPRPAWSHVRYTLRTGDIKKPNKLNDLVNDLLKPHLDESRTVRITTRMQLLDEVIKRGRTTPEQELARRHVPAHTVYVK